MLASAASDPDRLAIGIDADAGSMAESSRRAARAVARGGLPNALFVVASAESLPAELDGCADALTVHFPWGTLLAGLLSANPAVIGGIARVTRPGAAITALLSVTERDNLPGAARLGAEMLPSLAAACAAQGLHLVEARPAAAADLIASHSTWAKRLGAGTRRPVWLLRFCRRTPEPARDGSRGGADQLAQPGHCNQCDVACGVRQATHPLG